MQAKNYYLSIGIFVIGALAIIVAGIVALGGGGVMTEKHKYVMFFERSIQGLQVGAPVKIKGAKVGEVTNINIEIDGETLELEQGDTFTTPIGSKRTFSNQGTDSSIVYITRRHDQPEAPEFT